VRALVNQFTPAQDQDAVGPADLAQAMSDDKGGTLAADAPHGALNLIFGVAIYSAFAQIWT